MLTTEQSTITSSKNITGSKNAEDWLLFLNDFLLKYAAQIDLQENQGIKTTIVNYVTFGSIGLIIALQFGGISFWWLILIPFLFWIFIRQEDQEKKDVLNRIPIILNLKQNITFLTSTLFFLSQETKKDTLITLSLNLGNILDNEAEEKKKSPIQRRDFLTLKTNFPDKTTIQITIENKIKGTSIIKKSKKGRSKHSVKRINQTIYKVNIGFSVAQYQPKPNVTFIEKKEKYWLTSQTDTISKYDLLNPEFFFQYNNKYLWSEIAKNYAQMNVVK